MKRGYYIGLDTHSPFTEFAVMTEAGKISQRGQCATTIPAISDVLRAVPRPRFVTFEEGPLAGWLYRNLREDVDRLIVCEPRRNRLIAEDGDKDDPAVISKRSIKRKRWSGRCSSSTCRFIMAEFGIACVRRCN